MIATIADTFLIIAGAINLLNAVYISNRPDPDGKNILVNIISAFVCFIVAMLPL
jgi:hypothetical protein